MPIAKTLKPVAKPVAKKVFKPRRVDTTPNPDVKLTKRAKRQNRTGKNEDGYDTGGNKHQIPKHVFHGTSASPKTLKKTGGLQPNNPGFGPENEFHVYASDDLSTAKAYAYKPPERGRTGLSKSKRNYVYKIDTSKGRNRWERVLAGHVSPNQDHVGTRQPVNPRHLTVYKRPKAHGATIVSENQLKAAGGATATTGGTSAYYDRTQNGKHQKVRMPKKNGLFFKDKKPR